MDYILNTTGQKDVYYVSHSMATISFAVMASTLPDYGARVRVAALLAPVVYNFNIPHPLLRLAAYNKDIIKV